jgi:hypothetical protein
MSLPRNGFRRANRAADLPTGSTRLTRYVSDGRASIPDPAASVADGLAFARAREGRMAMFLYAAPTPEEIAELASAWELHPVLVEDLLHAGQRPKLERYGEVMFLVIRSAHYIDETEEVDFAEFHVLVMPGAVAVLCQDGRWIDGSDGIDLLDASRHERALLSDEQLLRLGPEAVVYRLIDAIVDGYPPVLQGVAIDKEQIERQVFSGERSVTERIYRLNLEVIEMQQTTTALDEVIDSLRAGFRKYGAPADVSAGRLRSSRPRQLARRRVPLGPLADPRRQRDARRAAAERGHEEDLGMGGDLLRAGAHRRDLRHELPDHAGTRLAARISVRTRRDAGLHPRALPDLQVAKVDVAHDGGPWGFLPTGHRHASC